MSKTRQLFARRNRKGYKPVARPVYRVISVRGWNTGREFNKRSFTMQNDSAQSARSFRAPTVLAKAWLFAAAGLFLALTGCGGSSGGGTPETRSVSYMVPTITPQPETKYLQEKGGLQISMAPATYAASEVVKYTYTPSQPHGGAFVMGPTGKTPQVHVDWVKETVMTVAPDRVKFLVKVNNQLPRVFRGAGMVVQFNVGGQLMPVEQQGYRPLVDVIVPPRSEAQVEILGPPLSAMKGNNGIVGIFLYDVVTNVNEAGVVTEKQNFEWYFNYTVENKQANLPYATGNGWMAQSDYHDWQQKKRAGNPAN
jgi:hypothetical protein